MSAPAALTSAATQLSTTQVSLPSYNTFGARVGLDNDHYRVTLYAKNLSDSRGITSYSSQRSSGFERSNRASFNRARLASHCRRSSKGKVE